MSPLFGFGHCLFFPILLEAHSWNSWNMQQHAIVTVGFPEKDRGHQAINEIWMSHRRYQCNKFTTTRWDPSLNSAKSKVRTLKDGKRSSLINWPLVAEFFWVTHGCTINNKQTKNKSCKTFPTCNLQKFTTDDNNQPGHPKCLAISRMPWLLRSTVRKV